MKTIKKYYLVLISFSVLSIFTNSSISYADGAVFPQHLAIYNATANGIPIVMKCGEIISLGINTQLEFDIIADANNDVFEVLNCTFTPPLPPGTITFSPPLPIIALNGGICHVSWVTPSAYLGTMNISVTDIYFTVDCNLTFDWVLPVELSSFVSIVNNNNVLLKWSTSSEINNLRFDIERSDVKGQTSDEWINVGHVQGSGTSSSPNSYEFTDRGLNSGKYNYRLKQIDYNGNYEYFNLSNEVVIGAPDKFSLSQNYPNPFNPVTNLEFRISKLEFVSLKVYDMLGKEVATIVNENLSPGNYSYTFDGSSLSGGIYFYKIHAGSFTAVRKMIMIK